MEIRSAPTILTTRILSVQIGFSPPLFDCPKILVCSSFVESSDGIARQCGWDTRINANAYRCVLFCIRLEKIGIMTECILQHVYPMQILIVNGLILSFWWATDGKWGNSGHWVILWRMRKSLRRPSPRSTPRRGVPWRTKSSCLIYCVFGP